LASAGPVTEAWNGVIVARLPFTAQSGHKNERHPSKQLNAIQNNARHLVVATVAFFTTFRRHEFCPIL
jgi:hypothetical protein